MAVTVELDLIDGASASHHLQSGWSITRLAMVRGVTTGGASGGQNTGNLFKLALDAVIAVVGDRGSACPDIPVHTYLEQFVPEAVTSEEVRVRIVYRGLPLPQYEICGSLSQIESTKDAHGDPIEVSYTYAADDVDAQRAGKTITQGGTVSRPLPEPTIIVRFYITAGTIGGIPRTAFEISTIFAGYLGKTNNATYTIGLIVGAATQWLISDTSARSHDGGASYEISLHFSYRTDGWNQEVSFTRPDDGKVPWDVVDGVGRKTVDVPTQITFPTFTFGPN